jgi:hypothetical protein
MFNFLFIYPVAVSLDCCKTFSLLQNFVNNTDGIVILIASETTVTRKVHSSETIINSHHEKTSSGIEYQLLFSTVVLSDVLYY